MLMDQSSGTITANTLSCLAFLITAVLALDAVAKLILSPKQNLLAQLNDAASKKLRLGQDKRVFLSISDL
jgi:hypothetical protein